MSRSFRTHVRLAGLVAAGAVAAATTLSAVPAQATTEGTTSLATVLAADGNHLDNRWGDFDILDKVVHRVLAAKPDSPVAVLADGTVPLTAFLPTDRAFRKLVRLLTGERLATEGAVLRAVNSVADVDTLEAILLYHVVPGVDVTYRQAKHADGAELTTALGPTIRVDVVGLDIRLRDQDPDAPDARVIYARSNLNQGNRQVAHGISRVLLPVDL
jgi:uncharacterized surface protein with fasciclin (FAS1) repeats